MVDTGAHPMSLSQTPPAAAGAPTPEAPSLRHDWALFTALTLPFGFRFSVYAGVFRNFLREVLHAGPLRMGGLELLREIPGLLTAITAVGIGASGGPVTFPMGSRGLCPRWE